MHGCGRRPCTPPPATTGAGAVAKPTGPADGQRLGQEGRVWLAVSSSGWKGRVWLAVSSSGITLLLAVLGVDAGPREVLAAPGPRSPGTDGDLAGTEPPGRAGAMSTHHRGRSRIPDLVIAPLEEAPQTGFARHLVRSSQISWPKWKGFQSQAQKVGGGSDFQLVSCALSLEPSQLPHVPNKPPQGLRTAWAELKPPELGVFPRGDRHWPLSWAGACFPLGPACHGKGTQETLSRPLPTGLIWFKRPSRSLCSTVSRLALLRAAGCQDEGSCGPRALTPAAGSVPCRDLWV